MGSLMNWFFVLTVISIGTTFFISLLNDDVNTDLNTQTDNEQTVINDYIKSGSLTIYEKSFFGTTGNQVMLIGINEMQSDDESTIQINNEDYLTVFMNKQGLVFTAKQDVYNKYIAELSVTRTSDDLSKTDEFDLNIGIYDNTNSFVTDELVTRGIKEVYLRTNLISVNNPSQTIDFAYSEVYEKDGFLTRAGSFVGDNFLGNLLTGLGGMPTWFNTIFTIITSMTIALGVLVTRGAN